MTATEYHKKLLRKFHTVCTGAGISDENKRSIVNGCGVSSSKEMTIDQLKQAIDAIDSEGNKYRRRVMAAIGQWLKQNQVEHTADTIKAIACRAAKVQGFNNIPVSKLRAIYHEFIKKNDTVAGAASFKEQVSNYLTTCN